MMVKPSTVRLDVNEPTIAFLTFGEISIPQSNLYFGIRYLSTSYLMCFNFSLKAVYYACLLSSSISIDSISILKSRRDSFCLQPASIKITVFIAPLSEKITGTRTHAKNFRMRQVISFGPYFFRSWLIIYSYKDQPRTLAQMIMALFICSIEVFRAIKVSSSSINWVLRMNQDFIFDGTVGSIL